MNNQAFSEGYFLMETKEKQILIVRNLVSESRGQQVRRFLDLSLEASLDGGMRIAVCHLTNFLV